MTDNTAERPEGDDHASQLDESWLGPDFDPLLLNPTRLLLMSELVTDSYYRFGHLCELVGARPPAMSRQVARLRKEGYLRSARGAYACMWVQRTPLGHRRFQDHVATLLAVIEEGRKAGETAQTAEPGREHRTSPLPGVPRRASSSDSEVGKPE